MVAVLRPKVLVPLVIVLVALIVGFLAVKSRGDDNTADLKTTTQTKNCPPIARADVAATKPDESIAIDVLANDTDPDGDPLVFQILKTDGGTSSIDDGGTPTDSSDDRLLFTPGNPPPETATIEYQALDPQGGFSTSTVAVSINETASLPEGARSASVDEPPPAGSVSSRCAESTPTTGGTDTTIATPETTSVTATTIPTSTATTTKSSSGSGSSGRRTTPTTKKNSTTTTAKKSSPTTGGGSFPTMQPPTTKPPATTSTTKKPPTSSPPTTNGVCGSPNPQSPAYNPNFADCIRGHTTTTHPNTTTTS